MAVIDSDAHVLETPATWEYLKGDEAKYKPMIVSQSFGDEVLANDGINLQKNYWMIGPRTFGKDRNVGNEMTRQIREMEDIPGRLRHMDELGIDIQVLYPTLYLRPITTDKDADLALIRSYNRWVADICSQSDGRLRWVVMPPIQSPERIREELLFGKENGACGVFMRGLEGDRAVGDPYFYPLYESAQEFDLAICFHSGNGSIRHHDMFETDTTFTKFKLATVGACHTIIEKRLPKMFPDLRWGFVEISAQWVPYVLCDLEDRFRRNGWDWYKNPLKENNIFVACENTDDLPYILGHSGEDNLVIGTDYGHHDPSSEVLAVHKLRDDPRVDPSICNKILELNAAKLYGLR